MINYIHFCYLLEKQSWTELSRMVESKIDYSLIPNYQLMFSNDFFIQVLIDHDVQFYYKHIEHNQDLIFWICRYSNVHMLKYICDKYPNKINLPDKIRGNPPISWLLACGRPIQMVQYLLELNPKLNQPSINGWLPIHWACWAGSVEIILLILSNSNLELKWDNIFVQIQKTMRKKITDRKIWIRFIEADKLFSQIVPEKFK
jgi:hypothetical protein